MNTALISSDPNVMMGKLVITGSRTTVAPILEKLAAGETKDQIIAAHPRLTPEAIQAVLAFAAEVPHADVVYPTLDSAGRIEGEQHGPSFPRHSVPARN